MNKETVTEISRIIGIDVSKLNFTTCTLLASEKFATRHIQKPKTFKKDKEGNKQEVKVPDHQMTGKGRALFISNLKKGDLVALEGGTSSANFAREIEQNSEATVILLNPGKLHNYLKSMCKTDAKDAARISEYMRDVNKVAWCSIPIPTQEEAESRSILQQQIKFKKIRTSFINQLHGLFNEYGFPEITKQDLKTEASRMEIIDRYMGDNEVLHYLAMNLARPLKDIEDTIESLEDTVKKHILEPHPEETVALMSLPRVGVLTAGAFIAYAGDCRRFAKPKQLRNYVALIPYKEQSGTSVDYTGGVVAFGCMPIRRNIMQSAWGIIQEGSRKRQLMEDKGVLPYYNRFEEIYITNYYQAKKGQKVAVKIANKLLTIAWTLVRSNQIWNGANLDTLNKKLKNNRISIKIKAIDEGCHPILEGSND